MSNRFRLSLASICVLVVVFTTLGFVVGVAPWKSSEQRPAVRPSPVHLNRYHHFTELMRTPGTEGDLRRFVSEYDAIPQPLLVLRPATRPVQNLFFFFHGMGGDRGDGVVVRDLVTLLDAEVVCIGGRGPAWLSDELLADATQVIREYTEERRRIYLIGISMGGTQVLSLAGLLPSAVREQIQGVVALIPGVDLLAMADRSSNQQVRRTLMASVDDVRSDLGDRSPDALIGQYAQGLPFAILYRSHDTITLVDGLQEFDASLRVRHHPVAVYRVAGDHEFVYRNLAYDKIMGSLGSNVDLHEAPTLSNAGQRD